MTLRPLIPVLALLAPLVAGDAVQFRPALPYRDGMADAKTATLTSLDLHLPAGRSGVPVMVWFHGGGLVGGDKADQETTDVARRFAAAGIAVASANYRLAPAVKAPVYVQDAAAAVAWVVAHIAEHGGDPRAVFVAGHSAGGWLAALLGADPRHLAEAGVQPTRIAGFITVSGMTNTHMTVSGENGTADPRLTPVIDAFAPVHHAARGRAMRPFLVLCGDRDWPARAEENAFFVAMIRNGGATDATWRQIADRDHGGIIHRMSDPTDPGARAILDFIARLRP